MWQVFQAFITFLDTSARAIGVYTLNTLGNAVQLSIAITSPGLGQLPNAERQQIANYCVAALGAP